MAPISDKPISPQEVRTAASPPVTASVQPTLPGLEAKPEAREPVDKGVQTADGLKDSATTATTADEKTYNGWESASKVARNNCQEFAQYLATGQIKVVPAEQAHNELVSLVSHLTDESTTGLLPITQTGRNMMEMTKQTDEGGAMAREVVGEIGYDATTRFHAANALEAAQDKLKDCTPEEREARLPGAIADAILEMADVKGADDTTLKQASPELFMAAEKYKTAHADPADFMKESMELSVKAAQANPQNQMWFEASAGVSKYCRSQGQRLGQGQPAEALDVSTAQSHFQTLAAYFQHDAFALFPPISFHGQDLQNSTKAGDRSAMALARFGGWDAAQRVATKQWMAQAKAIKADPQNPMSKAPMDVILASLVASDPDPEGKHYEMKLTATQYMTALGISSGQDKAADPNTAGNVAA